MRDHPPEMLDTSREPAPASADSLPADTPADLPADEPRGCLYALSQPPLMIFLTVIGLLFLLAALHDLYLL
ncbi:hypothetical protein GCM10010305_24580 [Streptomyces termitum]|uniref:Uncharacterized protein n=2 Tax=Streptomyces termitum TaxID=67368 RepID=A0A918W8A7_9ACTN|nr:hypothetical protein GCM10010305_24580 [Streptomyces termitum]